jgi:hypothetical protein
MEEEPNDQIGDANEIQIPEEMKMVEGKRLMARAALCHHPHWPTLRPGEVFHDSI